MTHAVGSLVKCRGREWVVLPNGSDDPKLLMLRPLGGTEDEVTGIYMPLEPVESASFPLPDPADVGDHVSCRLLRDAVRLGFRASAGPFRSFSRIACEPRPYQLVPLMMALKLDPVRLLIADDVGVGKTIEACLIARELLDRGEASRLAVLCPPHLAEQWQAELKAKFHIDAELVLSSTVSRLERQCGMGQSLFDVFPFVIVSTDYIKSSSRRDEFLRTCPSLVIVDEAHSCAARLGSRGNRHFRHELLKGLSADKDRHLILVTATPHSGIEACFRSLLGLLDDEFAELPDDISGKDNEHHRRKLAAHLIQRRRADIRSYLNADTPFPEREEKEATYKLTPDYKNLFDKVLKYVRERISEPTGGVPQYRQRVRWWAALALLRSLASSPAAAVAALRTKAAGLKTDNETDVDELGRQAVMDTDSDEELDIVDTVPGADTIEEDEGLDKSERRRLNEMVKLAEKLHGGKDAKLDTLVDAVKQLLGDGFTPIIFCRFIATAEYVAQELRQRFKKVEIDWVTGLLPPEERERRVHDLGALKADGKQIILVATDCLSEGINLQMHFDAVIHYDLGWSPTRHEQRDGRVDRFGQPKKVVRSQMIYGVDNQIDGIVLEVLLRKHKAIRSTLGISVPVPANSNAVMEALFEGLLLRSSDFGEQLLFEEIMVPEATQLHADWDNATQREQKSRTLFAQHTLRPEDVARELDEVQRSIGTAETVQRFLETAVTSCGGAAVSKNSVTRYDFRPTPRAVRDACGLEEGKAEFSARFELPVDEGVLHLTRTHPIIEGLAAHVMDTALDPVADSVARRCGVIYTKLVEKRTTLLLLRLRYHIITKRRGGDDSQLLAEDCCLMGFMGAPERAEWIANTAVMERLLDATPAANIDPDRASGFVRTVVDGYDALQPHIEGHVRVRGDEILDSHRRVREASRLTGVQYEIEPQLPPDVIGVYVYLPA